MFELRQLRCFVTVAEQLHFGRAATRLNMTQPPLSRQIQLLEREVGAPLFDRNSPSVALTPVGRVFLPEARRILRISESAMRWTRRVWRGEAGTLSIGFTAASGYGMLPDLIRRMHATMPDVDVVLREMVTGQQMDALSSGLLDVGFLRPPVDPHLLASRPFVSESCVAAIHAGDPLADRATMPLRALDDHPFIMFSPDASRYFHDLLAAEFERGAVRPRVRYQVGQMHSMLALVDAGLGAALVPEAAARLRFPNVLFRPVDLQPGIVRLSLAWLPANENPVLRQFLRAQEDHVSTEPTTSDPATVEENPR